MHHRILRRVIIPSIICLSSLALPVAASGDQLKRETIPGKWIEPLLPEDLPPLDYPKYFKDLDRAEMEAFRGRYKKSLQTLKKVAPAPGDPETTIRAALVRGTALNAIGKKNEAIDALSQPAVKDDPRVQIKRANVLVELGKLAEARDLLKELLAKHADSLAGHYYLGEISEQLGDLPTAREMYAWFVAPPQSYLDKAQGGGELGLESAEDVTLLGRALDRWATLNGAYQTNEQLHDTILNIFVRAYDVIDRAYWPAHVAAAEYYLSHDNDKEAGNELAAALDANPGDIAALDLFGKIALGNFNFDAADKAIAAIRKVDAKSIPADLLETRNLLHQRRPIDAQPAVQHVLAEQPKNIEALGLLAASQFLTLHDEQANTTLKQVDAIDPTNASAYFECAEQLGAMRQYPRSAAMYKIAIDRAPWWTAARNGLGLLYTQSGDEDQAKITLDAAHSVDPFNLRTTNYLRLLDDLEKLARKETPNFVVMYDAQLDPLIPEYFADYLESIHNDVCGDFKFSPKVKTYIEVFPTHDAFSVRTTGSPWIGTVGASTGRVIALVSPRAGQNTLGTFNWSQVLRHEFTHTVTLGMTDNRIPHWFTEGLAVWEEHAPLRWEWIPMLYHAVKHDELFTMDKLTWGFVRPRKPTDRQLAYAESFWICRYLDETYGHPAILKMLDGFRAGGSEEEVFKSVLGKSLPAFFEEFSAWTRKQIATWGYDDETKKKYDELRERGEGLIKAKQYDEAVKVWEQIALLHPVDAMPHTRLAGLYLTKQVNRPDKAIEHLIALAQVELKDNRYAKRVARLYRDTGKLEDAQHWALESVYIDPYDPDAHNLLAEIAERTGDNKTLEREHRVIPELEKWIQDNRKRAIHPDAAE
jgi:tetratricopeptide (TPR) repeat protein